MQILTLQSLDKLKKFVTAHDNFSDLIEMPLDELDETYSLGLHFVELELSVSEDQFPELIVDNPDNDIVVTDVQNAPHFYHALNCMTPAHATDERIWTTLSLTVYRSYVLSRWRDNNSQCPTDGKSLRTWIVNHWLCGSSNRSKFRDNAVSRLWWMGKVCYSVEGWKPEEVAQMVITNTDYRQQLLDRTSSFAASGVTKAILELSRELESDGRALSRQAFRKVMSEVNYFAGRSNLAAMTDKQLIQLLGPLFRNQGGDGGPPAQGPAGGIIGRFFRRS